MKKICFFFAICLVSLSYATEYKVSVGESIQTALDKAQSGDVVMVADGVFYEGLEIKEGVTLQGSGQTVLCGKGLKVERGINNYGTVRNMIIELFDSEHDGAGIYNHAGLVEFCIVRGCRTREAAIWNEGPGTLRNCLIHNNEPSVASWPNSGGFYNPEGFVINCTSVCNYGHYAGWHSESAVYNSVSWGHAQEPGFTDKASFIESSTTAVGSGNNATNSGFESKHYPVKLSADNMSSKGPRFVDPTPFCGAPTTEDEIVAMRLADFRIKAGSALIDKGKSTDDTPSLDLLGVTRPMGEGMDIGAYEYDPNSPIVPVTGVSFYRDSITVVAGETGLLVKQIVPTNATDKSCRWIASDTCISVDNGVVTGVTPGFAKVTLITNTGHYIATAKVRVLDAPEPYVCPEVLAADSLYHIEDYTIPSYIPMWVAKEAARRDSCPANLDTLALRISELKSKYEPYCLVTNINGDPATQMAFAWFTNDSVFDGQIQLVPVANATDADFEGDNVISMEAAANRTKPLRYAVSTSGLLKSIGLSVLTKYTYVGHKILVTDLTPGTTYCYRVGFPGHWSDIYTFQTSEQEQGEFSFLYMTDSHLMNREYVENAHWCAAAAAKAHPDARFLVFPGDHVETGDMGNSEWEWERWFEYSMQPVLAKMPVAPTDGNHDDSSNQNYSLHFNTNNDFNKVSKVKPQFQGITYSFVYGDVLFLVYSKQDYWRGSYNYKNQTSDYLTRDVGNWFREQVALHPNTKWRVALVHYNIFSGSGHQTDEMTPMFRATMLPVMKECEIDVVLQGHDHCYEVIGPVDPDTRTPILSAIKDVEDVEKNTVSNMTGKKGGTFCTDDGTLYFIGATCGRKRYEPYSRSKMENGYSKHLVENYFDLFTGMFGQPGAPSYTKITATADTLTFNSYTANREEESTLFNTFHVVRTKEHSAAYTDLEPVAVPQTEAPVKFLNNGQLYIAQKGTVYTMLGQKVQ